MANYLITLDSNTYSDDASAQNAIVSAGGAVVKALSFGLTYEASITEEQLLGLSGVIASERADQTVSARLQYDLSHLSATVNGGFYNPTHTGAGQHIYLIDTGVSRVPHELAEQSVNNLWSNFVNDPIVDEFDDGNGHGTAIAAMAIGKHIGAAPGATLHNIKLFNTAQGDLTVGEIIDALDSALAHHLSNDQYRAKVVCLPWTIDKNDFVDAKVAELNASNMVVVAAAGNEGVDVNTKSPAGVNDIITVGSTNLQFEVSAFTNTALDEADQVSSFVNYGAEVDIFAIGENVNVPVFDTEYEFMSASGTSISAGICAGIATHYIERNPAATSNEIKEQLLQEGHPEGYIRLKFDESDPLVDYSAVYRALVTTENIGQVGLTVADAGRVANVRRSSGIQTVDLGLNTDATEVAVLDFAPMPTWMSFDIETGIVSIDTDAAADIPVGVYLFAIKGRAGGELYVEEFGVGLYDVTEAEVDGATSTSYYYDEDSASYDEVVVHYESALGFQKF